MQVVGNHPLFTKRYNLHKKQWLNQDHSDPDVVYMYVRVTKTVHLLVEAVEQGRLLACRPEMLLL